MPKLKTHSGAKKRFGTTGTGKIKRSRAYKRHNLNASDFGKSSKRKRRLRKGTLADATNVKALKLLIPYK
ncbi:MAG: 50S ribosomal protein L35 [Oscillospiraceae bacterium]|jgi:large subunit ribosomal protein L35|nr:50S ribosomal protein L35 [Oscillospiraceae bacterium]